MFFKEISNEQINHFDLLVLANDKISMKAKGASACQMDILTITFGVGLETSCFTEMKRKLTQWLWRPNFAEKKSPNKPELMFLSSG